MKSLFFPAGWGLGSRGFSPGLGQQSESTEGGSEVCVCESKAEDEAVEGMSGLMGRRKSSWF